MTTPYNTPLPNEFDDENDFWRHELCKMYESNRLGVVRNKFTKNVVGHKGKDGYYRFTCNSDCCKGEKKNKKYRLHRFVYECYFGLILDDRVVDHINNIKTDNRLENLQVITQSENSKKDDKRCDTTPIKVSATNIESAETFIYKSLYGASKDLHICRASISKVLRGIYNSVLSKKYNEAFTFEKISEQKPEEKPLIIKNKINIKLKNVKSMTINNNKC